MKRKLSLSLAALMLISALSVPVNAQDNIAITINGTELEMLYGPVIEDNRTLVPLRDVLEAMGAEVNWNNEAKTVTSSLGDKTVQLAIGSEFMSANDEQIALDVPARIIDTKTYVPLRAISEGLGAEVNWDAESKTISITTSTPVDTGTPSTPAYTLKQYANSVKSGSREIVPAAATYPVFSGNGRVVKRINSYITADAQSRVNNFKTSNSKRLYQLYQQCIKDGTRDIFDDYEYNLTYEVKCNDSNIISLCVTQSTVTDKEDSTTVSGITFNSVTGNVLTADELYENASAEVKKGLIAEGFADLDVNRLNLDDNSFYIENGKMVYVVNKGVLSAKAEQYSLELPEAEEYTPLTETTAIGVVDAAASDMLLSQTDDIVMKLNTSYPEFTGKSEFTAALNSLIAKAQQNEMSAYKEQNKAEALAAYKTFEETKDKKTDRFEPWLWTSDYKVKYNNNKIASVVTSAYTYKGDGTESTVYSAYTCNLETGKLIDVNILISDTAKTDSLARTAFKELIEKNRLNFYTDVYDRFNLTKATKYISAEGVTYMFNPGELASVSKGVIEVTVPLQ